MHRCWPELLPRVKFHLGRACKQPAYFPSTPSESLNPSWGLLKACTEEQHVTYLHLPLGCILGPFVMCLSQASNQGTVLTPMCYLRVIGNDAVSVKSLFLAINQNHPPLQYMSTASKPTFCLHLFPRSINADKMRNDKNEQNNP